jgi:hypothetical protein
MQDFEIPRYNNAKQAFGEAFHRGLAQGLAALAIDKMDRDPGVPEAFFIDVPRNDVLDNVWQEHCQAFAEAGRRAAYASRRRGEPKLDTSQATDQHWETSLRNVYRWVVVLNPN